MSDIALGPDQGIDQITPGGESAESAGSLTAGVLSAPTGQSSNSLTGISWTAASGGTGTITAQLQRRRTGVGSFANVSGATSSPANISGLSADATYDLRVVFTDSDDPTNPVYSNTVTGTTEASSGGGADVPVDEIALVISALGPDRVTAISTQRHRFSVAVSKAGTNRELDAESYPLQIAHYSSPDDALEWADLAFDENGDAYILVGPAGDLALTAGTYYRAIQTVDTPNQVVLLPFLTVDLPNP